MIRKKLLVVLLICSLVSAPFSSAFGMGTQQILQSVVLYHQANGNKKLLDAYDKLLFAEQQEENHFARRTLRSIRSGMEKRYPILLGVESHAFTARRFLNPDGTDFVPTPIPAPATTASASPVSKLTVAQKLASAPKSTPDKLSSELYGERSSPSVASSIKDTIKENSENTIENTIEVSPQINSENKLYALENGSIDIGQLQRAWQGRVNEVRAQRNLKTLRLQPKLDVTAAERSTIMRDKGVADHRRSSTSSYYNYGEITQRFAHREIIFLQTNRTTYTENIGRGVFRCSVGDCTQDAIDSLHRIFQFFRNEQGQANDVHWRSMIQPFFTEFGLGIAVDQGANKFYVTIHYAVGVE